MKLQVKSRNRSTDASAINKHAGVYPSDLLNRKWVRSFRKKFGPLNPAAVVVFGPLGCVSASVVLLFFAQTTRVMFSSSVLFDSICLLASVVSFVALLFHAENAVPDRSIPVEEARRAIEMRLRLDRFGFLASSLFVFATAIWINGPEGFIAVVIFFALGMSISLSYLAFTTHIHVCPIEGLPKAFRMRRGRWSCTSCGTPFEQTHSSV